MAKWYERWFSSAKRKAERKIDAALKDGVLQRRIQARLRNELVTRANEKIDLPFLNEKAEAWLIGTVYDLTVDLVGEFLKEKLT